MVKDWKKEVKPLLEKITAEEGGKLTERVLDYQASRNMQCLTCQNNINSTRAFTLPTEDKEIFRWLCEACGDNVINYYQQIHGMGDEVRKIVSMRRFDMKRGTMGTWKLEICIAYFGKRYCSNCVYETEMRKMKGRVVDKNVNRIEEIGETVDWEADYKHCLLSVKLLESDFDGVDPRLFTVVSYLCKPCADEWMKDFRDSGDDIIGIEENLYQRMEQRIESVSDIIFGKFKII